MSDFRKLSNRVWASPQIGFDDISEASELGVSLIINNRPEGESDDQTPGSDIAAAAQNAGLNYIAIPITHSGFSENQVKEMVQALEQADGPILAYCRSGTRSTLLWALAQASTGASSEEIASAAAAAGYDIAPIRPAVDALAARHTA